MSPVDKHDTDAIDQAQMQQNFFRAKRFAVVGASKDTSKFGTKVLQWYQARKLPVTPVHYKEEELEGLKTVRSIADLPNASETAISIVTPPKVTLEILKLAQALDVPALWLQPGAEDEAVCEFLASTRAAGAGVDQEHGEDGGQEKEGGNSSRSRSSRSFADRVVLGGPCVPRDGDSMRFSL